MATFIDIDGVSTWTETRGSGERTLVLLHGGLGNSDDLLDSIGAADLVGSFRVVAFDRRGHGYTADTDEPFHYDDMATHAIKVLEHLAPHRRSTSSDGATAASWRCSSRFAGPTSSIASCSSAPTSTSRASTSWIRATVHRPR